jgi:hypothetical protein
MRLSATEVEGGDSDDDTESAGAGHGSGSGLYHRSGSGRSSGRNSVNSARNRGLTYRQSGSGASGRLSAGHSPPSEREENDSLNDLDEVTEETPVPGGHHHARAKDYFAPTPASADSSIHRSGSGSSGERADGLGELEAVKEGGAAKLASNSLLRATVTREKSTKNPEELRRRGSVDDRTMTMSAGRLFVANPDVDSD